MVTRGDGGAEAVGRASPSRRRSFAAPGSGRRATPRAMRVPDPAASDQRTEGSRAAVRRHVPIRSAIDSPKVPQGRPNAVPFAGGARIWHSGRVIRRRLPPRHPAPDGAITRTRLRAVVPFPAATPPPPPRRRPATIACQIQPHPTNEPQTFAAAVRRSCRSRTRSTSDGAPGPPIGHTVRRMRSDLAQRLSVAPLRPRRPRPWARAVELAQRHAAALPPRPALAPPLPRPTASALSSAATPPLGSPGEDRRDHRPDRLDARPHRHHPRVRLVRGRSRRRAAQRVRAARDRRPGDHGAGVRL